MKGKPYKAALKRAGLSIRKGGPFLGFTSRQSQRIASGDADCPEAARKLLVVMQHFSLTAETAALIPGV